MHRTATLAGFGNGVYDSAHAGDHLGPSPVRSVGLENYGLVFRRAQVDAAQTRVLIAECVSKVLCDPRAICAAYARDNTRANSTQIAEHFASDRDSDAGA